MSGPYDRPDDPDEVTLWAGRLRSWPANPPAPADEVEPDVDDSTVRSGGGAPDDATVTARRARNGEELDDATVIARRAGDADATVVARRRGNAEEPDDATVVAHRAAPVDEPDDATVVAHRAVPAPELDDDTVHRVPANEQARRRGEVAPPSVDDDTEPGSRTRRPSVLAEPDESARHRIAPDDTEPGSRTRRPSALVEPDDTTRPRTAPGDTEDTRAGSRRARRAASAAPSPGGAEWATVARESAVPGALREARVPTALQRESYDPRVDAPIRVERSVRPAPSETRRDAALVRPRARRGSAWRALFVGAAVVLLLAAAAGAAVLFLG